MAGCYLRRLLNPMKPMLSIKMPSPKGAKVGTLTGGGGGGPIRAKKD